MSTQKTGRARKLLLIGWDAADWKVIHPLIDAGEMPNLERLINGGVIGNMSTLNPILSPMLWTSIATGKRPYKHGIHGFIEPDPHAGGVRPITNLSRKTKAIWNILSQSGLKCNVVGWWPSHPAEPINGVMVSNHYQKAVAPPDKPWPMQVRTVFPPHLAPHLADLRVHHHLLEEEHLLPFVPRAQEIDQKKDPRLLSLARIVSECTSIHAAATAIMQLETWDFMAVYYDAIDHFSHAFMKYHPPRLDWVPEKDFEIYKEALRGGYRYHDMMLGTLLALAGEETTVILMSDHGFHSDHLRPRVLPNEPVGPAAEHRPLGIFVINGPGIKRDERVYGATLLDVTPTILHLFGLPVGGDMDGRVLAAAFENPAAIESVESWDLIDGPSGQHPPDMRIDAVDAQEAINQLVALGYIDQPDQDKTVAAKEATRELNYHLALAYIDGQQHRKAAEILRELWTQWPEELRFGITLLQCALALETAVEARETIDRIQSMKADLSAKAAEALEKLKEAHKDTPPGDLDTKAQQQIRRLKARATANPAALAYAEAGVLQLEGRLEEALAKLNSARTNESDKRVHVWLRRGEILFKLSRGDEAEACFRQALELDPMNPQAHLGLCRRYLKQRKYEQAAESARDSLGALFYNPQAHYFHGIALRRLGEPEIAIKALEMALSQNPNFPRAHSQLAMIYWRDFRNDAKARHHREAARQTRLAIHKFRHGDIAPLAAPAAAERRAAPDVIRLALKVPPEQRVTVVSGLPRSGTSLMMQMLAAGGVPILTDNARQSDQSNPKGYFEHEKIKGLAKDASWFHQARGHAVKVVANLVRFIPMDIYCKFIFMERDLDEILRSQDTMLDASGRSDARANPQALRATYPKLLNSAQALVSANPRYEMITVMHRDVLQRPADVARRVADFLEIPGLDVEAMAAVVDSSLYRARSEHQAAIT